MRATTKPDVFDVQIAEAVDTRLTKSATLGRRSFLQGALISGAGVMIGTQCVGDSASASRHLEATPAFGSAESTPTTSNILLAYFSRAGENYYYGGRTDLAVGNTEVLAGMIAPLIGCDIHRIEPVEPYSNSYDETVARNVREQDADAGCRRRMPTQDADARPAIANPLPSIAHYDVVLMGSPIWNIRAPMIMSTFAESFDFTGKTIFPFTTYAVSRLGTTERDYAASCPGAAIGEGLAVRGEEVREAGDAVEDWLQRIGLMKS